MKPKNKRSNASKNIISGSSTSIAPDSPDDEFFNYRFFIFSHVIGYAQRKKIVTKFQRCEGKNFSALVDENGSSVDERIVEMQMDS